MPTWFVTGVAALSLILALLAGYRVDWTRAREGKILAFVALFLLPVAGLVFFPYRGKDTSIHAVELIYSGAAGKATLTFPR